MHRFRIITSIARHGLVLVGVAALFIGSASVFAQSFEGLGFLNGGSWSRASGVSADGSVVVGVAKDASGYQAFRWTSGSGVVGLGFVSDGFYSSAWTVSGDGSTVVGNSASSTDQAFRWTSDGGMVGLGFLNGGSYSHAYGVSADGSVVAGHASTASGYQAFRWTSDGGMVGLGSLSNLSSSAGYGVSADGSVVVGYGYAGSTYQAFRWTTTGGMVGLGSGEAFAVSADGSTVVGESFSDSSFGQAFRWTSADGMVGLGLPSGDSESWANAASADGSVVVGGADTGSHEEAFIWDAVHGTRRLRDVFVNDYGLDLTGWTLTEAMGISADGSTLVGWAQNPSGNTEAWIAQIPVQVPEPGTYVLVALGGSLLLLRRRLVRW